MSLVGVRRQRRWELAPPSACSSVPATRSSVPRPRTTTWSVTLVRRRSCRLDPHRPPLHLRRLTGGRTVRRRRLRIEVDSIERLNRCQAGRQLALIRLTVVSGTRRRVPRCATSTRRLTRMPRSPGTRGRIGGERHGRVDRFQMAAVPPAGRRRRIDPGQLFFSSSASITRMPLGPRT